MFKPAQQYNIEKVFNNQWILSKLIFRCLKLTQDRGKLSSSQKDHFSYNISNSLINWVIKDLMLSWIANTLVYLKLDLDCCWETHVGTNLLGTSFLWLLCGVLCNFLIRCIHPHIIGWIRNTENQILIVADIWLIIFIIFKIA